MINKTKKITEGAVLIAIVGVALIINRYLGGALIMGVGFVLPFPLLIYTSKYGIRDGLVVLAAMLFITYLFADFTYIVMAILYYLVGLIYGSLVYKKANNKTLLISTIVASLISQLIIILASTFVFGYSLIDEGRALINTLSEFVSIPNDTFMSIALPTVVISYLLVGIMEALLVHLLSHTILPRLNIDIQPIGVVRIGRIPRVCGFVLLGILSLNFLGLYFDGNTYLMQMVYIFSIIVMTTFLFYGIFVAVWLIKVFNANYMYFVLIGCALFLPSYFALTLGVFGAIDMCFEVRFKLYNWRQNVK